VNTSTTGPLATAGVVGIVPVPALSSPRQRRGKESDTMATTTTTIARQTSSFYEVGLRLAQAQRLVRHALGWNAEEAAAARHMLGLLAGALRTLAASVDIGRWERQTLDNVNDAYAEWALFCRDEDALAMAHGVEARLHEVDGVVTEIAGSVGPDAEQCRTWFQLGKQIIHVHEEPSVGQLLEQVGMRRDLLFPAKAEEETIKPLPELPDQFLDWHFLEEGLKNLRSHEEAVVETGAQAPVGNVTVSRPPVSAVVVSFGGRNYSLEAEGRKPVAIPSEYTKFFALFVTMIAEQSPNEVVSWNLINQEVRADADPRTASTKARQHRRRFSDYLTKELGNPPDGEDWFVTRRGQGCRLNSSVQWSLSNKLKRMLSPGSRRPQPVNPRIIEESEYDDNREVERHGRRPSGRRSDPDEE
jgi:hypothetical protein